MSAIYKKELRGYFTSVIGYLVVAALVLFIGVYFTAYNLNYGYPSFSYALANVGLIIIIAVPLLTMRSLAEERKNRTDQLLLTSPVSVGGVVFAKWLSMMTVLAVPLLISCICPLIIMVSGSGRPLSDYSTIFAFFCMCGVYVAIGEWISSLTENQIVAAVLTVAALLLLYLWDNLISFIPNTASASYIVLIIATALLCVASHSFTRNVLITIIIGAVGIGASTAAYLILGERMANLASKALGSFSMMKPLDNFAIYSIFDLRGIVLYLSLTALFLFLTMQTVQKRRWS